MGFEAGNRWSVAALWAWLGTGGARETLDWRGGQGVEAPDWFRGNAGLVGLACVESGPNCFRFLNLSSHTHGHSGWKRKSGI